MRLSDLLPNVPKDRPWVISSQFKPIFDVEFAGLDPMCQKEVKKLQEFLEPLSESKYRFGIEVELENINDGFQHYWGPSRMWKIKPDGSLRNYGMEFISPALKAEEVCPSVAVLYGWLNGTSKFLDSHPECSWRTSIHVHVETYHMNVNSFKNLLLLYLVFESSLFEFAEAGRRETNIFCTPLSRVPFYDLIPFILASTPEEHKTALTIMKSAFHKYSAVNLQHLFDFGTLEFRHMRATMDSEKLMNWVEALNRLYLAADRLKPKEIFQQIMELNTNSKYMHFMEDVFGEDIAAVLTFPSYQSHLSAGISLAKELLNGIKGVQKVKFSPESGLDKFIQLEGKKMGKDPLSGKVQSGLSAQPMIEQEVIMPWNLQTAAQTFTIVVPADLNIIHPINEDQA